MVWQPAVSCIRTFNRLSNRVVQPVWQTRFDNRVERTATVRSIGSQTGLYNRFDNRLNVCIHDTTGCQSGLTTSLTTGLTTGCIVYTNIYPVVKPPNNRFDNRLYRVNGALYKLIITLVLTVNTSVTASSFQYNNKKHFLRIYLVIVFVVMTTACTAWATHLRIKKYKLTN